MSPQKEPIKNDSCKIDISKKSKRRRTDPLWHLAYCCKQWPQVLSGETEALERYLNMDFIITCLASHIFEKIDIPNGIHIYIYILYEKSWIQIFNVVNSKSRVNIEPSISRKLICKDLRQLKPFALILSLWSILLISFVSFNLEHGLFYVLGADIYYEVFTSVVTSLFYWKTNKVLPWREIWHIGKSS